MAKPKPKKSKPSAKAKPRPKRKTAKPTVAKKSPAKPKAKPAPAAKNVKKPAAKPAANPVPKPPAKGASTSVAKAPVTKSKAPRKPEPAATRPPTLLKPTPAPKPEPAPKSALSTKQTPGRNKLRQKVLERRTAKPIAFTLDEVREIAKVNVDRATPLAPVETKESRALAKLQEVEEKLKQRQPNHVGAASLADILGYNPVQQSVAPYADPAKVDPKFQRYYKLLLQMREQVVEGLTTHTEETLKRSAKEDAGDLSGYGQHMADAGTDTSDRDFALSLVSSEQELLAEIEAAIQRIHKGTYGVCENTGKPIAKERLLAVPFARYSVESQAEVERTRRRTLQRGGVFGDIADGDTPKAEEDSDE
jgi:RNA polymerase-binding transcription factor DksA